MLAGASTDCSGCHRNERCSETRRTIADQRNLKTRLGLNPSSGLRARSAGLRCMPLLGHGTGRARAVAQKDAPRDCGQIRNLGRALFERVRVICGVILVQSLQRIEEAQHIPSVELFQRFQRVVPPL